MLVPRHEKTPVEMFLNALRLPFAAVTASIVTLCLFYLMQFLIEGGEEATTGEKFGKIVDFTRVRQVMEVQTRKRRPTPPPIPDEMPKVVSQTLQSNTEVDAWSTHFAAPTADVGPAKPNLNFRSDGAYLPILKVQPVYPSRALEQGLIGWVYIEFTVDEIGRVLNPEVIDNCVKRLSETDEPCENRPRSTFDKSAIAAALKFKYKPRVVDGMPIATAGVRNMITFEIEDE